MMTTYIITLLFFMTHSSIALSPKVIGANPNMHHRLIYPAASTNLMSLAERTTRFKLSDDDLFKPTFSDSLRRFDSHADLKCARRDVRTLQCKRCRPYYVLAKMSATQFRCVGFLSYQKSCRYVNANGSCRKCKSGFTEHISFIGDLLCTGSYT